jgi:hypothetical protein
VAVQVTLRNDGSRVLTGVSGGLTLVDVNAHPFTTSNNSLNCPINPAGDGIPACVDSSYGIDLAPSDSGTMCSAIAMPASDPVAEVQFDPTKVFSGSAFDTVAIWHLPNDNTG